MTAGDDDRMRMQYRRLLLQRRLTRSAEAEIFRQVAEPLRRAGVRFARLPPAVARRALGDLSSLPGRDERIDWSRVEGADCRSWGPDDDREVVLRAALEACACVDERVAVIWHPCKSGLRIRAGDLAAHARLILDAGSEIWICRAEPGSWLIEYAMADREICFGGTPVP